jgi:hypothetical protein
VTKGPKTPVGEDTICVRSIHSTPPGSFFDVVVLVDQRHHVLFTMLTTLGYRYASGCEPAVITGIRLYLGGWAGIGRVVGGMARQQ